MTDGKPEAVLEAVAEAVDTDEPVVAIARVVDGQEPAALAEDKGVTTRPRRGRAPRPPRGGSRREREKTRHMVTARVRATKKNPAPSDIVVLYSLEKNSRTCPTRIVVTTFRAHTSSSATA